MNARETALLNNAISKRKAYIEAQMKLKKSERDQQRVNDQYNRVAIMKHWIKYF